MKKIFLFFLFVLVFFVLQKPVIAITDEDLAASCREQNITCTSIDVSFSDVQNWPGDSVDVGCKGGIFGVGESEAACCKGDRKQIKPGQSVTLNGCNCKFAQPDGSGCFFVDRDSFSEKVKESCQVTDSGGFCQGQNGNISTPASLSASCEAPPPPPGEESPPPSPPSQGESPTPSPSGAEESPTPTPTITASPSASGSASPTPPVTSPPSSPPVSPTPPTVTFNPAMCQCDGIQSSLIFPGQSATFTGKAKVTGTDTSAAKVADMTYFVAKDSTVIAKSDPIPAQIVDSSPSIIHYKTSWQYTLPQNVDPNSIYRVWTQQRCVKKELAFAGNVLGTSTATSTNLWSNFLDFILKIFGGGTNFNATPKQTNPQPPPNVSNLPQDASTSDNKNLQLQPLYPAKILPQSKELTCRFVMFQFQNR